MKSLVCPSPSLPYAIHELLQPRNEPIVTNAKQRTAGDITYTRRLNN